VVATTEAAADDAVVQDALRHGAKVTRGSADDVLARYFFAATEHGADPVVRVTADCPLFDPDVLDGMLQRWRRVRAGGRRLDYLSNTVARSFPRGLDAEIFTYAALEKAHRGATLPHQREHVTPYLWENPQDFAIEQFTSAQDMSRFRLTLDTPEDWQLIESIFEQLGSGGRRFGTGDVLALMQAQPELAAINAHVEQKKVGQ
jgi:spore coat polysaccharide biosynthesis protein SpsF